MYKVLLEFLSVIVKRPTGLVREFLHEIIPLDIEEWGAMSLAVKFAICVKVCTACNHEISYFP